MRKCWNCGQPTTDDDLRVCDDPICQRAAISSRAKANEKIKASKDKARQRGREYYKRPEVKERQREYRQRPEVKEQINKYQRERYQRLKKLREEE